MKHTIHTVKEAVKLFLFAEGMVIIIYEDNPKESILKTPKSLSELSKVTGYKMITQKLIVFLYTSHVKLEIEIKNQ